MKLLKILELVLDFLNKTGISGPKVLVGAFVLSAIFILGIRDFQHSFEKQTRQFIKHHPISFLAVNNVRLIHVNNRITGSDICSLPLTHPSFIVVRSQKSSFSESSNILNIDIMKTEELLTR